MRINTILLFSALLLITCKSSKELEYSNRNSIHIKSPKEVNKDSQISFEFVNSTSKEVIIQNPAIKNIYKYVEGNWIKVRILYCPCGADCIPPPKTKRLKPGETHKYSWNLKESWCGKKRTNNIFNTIEHKSSVGIYRTTIFYSSDKNKQGKIIKKFNIIN